MDTVQDYLVSNARKCRRHAARFRATFGVPLRRYWRNDLGFDVVRFDTDVVQSADRSMADTVSHKWGAEALALLRQINKESPVN